MKFERSHLFFGCDIMNYFIFSLFLLLLFDSPQGSAVAHRRSTRALNTTLETDFDGTYERRNPCTNAEVEKSSYKASHEFRHYSKESNWSEYSRKCTAIISGFLQAIGNLVRFNNEQKGIFNFHINTSISQRQDRHSDSCQEKLCPSLPTIIIEATDGDISQNAALKNDPIERPSVKQSNCSIIGYSQNGVSEVRQKVGSNQEEENQKPTMTANSFEKEPVDDTFYPTAPESQPESTSIYSQDTVDTNQQQSARQRQAYQDENIAVPNVPQIPSSPVLFPFPGIAQTQVMPPAAFTAQNYAPRPDFYGTPARPEYSPENNDANTITTQPRNEIRIPNIEPPSPQALGSENQFQPAPAYQEKSDKFNSFPVPSTTSGQYNDGTNVNIPETAENVAFYQSDEPRTTTGEDQLLENQYQSGQQSTNVIPEQPFGDSLGGQESNSRPLATSFAPVDQFPTTVLPPEDRFNSLNKETEFGSPSGYPNQIPPVLDEPQTLPVSNIQDVKTVEQEITPEPNPSPELADLPYRQTPSGQESVGISQPNFLPNGGNSFFLPNSVQNVRLNPPFPVLVPPPQQPQNNLFTNNPQFVPENQETTPNQITTVNSEYDELSNQRLMTQPPQGEDTSSNIEAKPSSDGPPSPFIQLSPVQTGIPGEAPAEVPYDSPTFTSQSDIPNGQSPIIDQPLNDNQASEPTAFIPEQSSNNKYYPSPQGQGDFSFETQRATPSDDSEPILNNVPAENTAEELPRNPEFNTPAVPAGYIPTNNQNVYFNSAFQPTSGPEVQHSFPSTPVGSELPYSPNYNQYQPNTIKIYNETITTVADTIYKEPTDRFVSTLPTEQPPLGTYETEQPQFKTIAQEPQIQATVAPQLGLGDEYAQKEMSGLPASDFNRQQTPSFVQPHYQAEENAPVAQFPSNYFPEQQPEGNYNMIQSQTTPEGSFEDSQRRTDAPAFSDDNGNGRTTSFPDLNNQQTPNTFIQSDSQVGGNSPFEQFPSQQQPVGNYEAGDSQIAASNPSENIQLQTNEDSKFLPPVEPASTFDDQQNSMPFLPTQSPIGADEPFKQLPATTSPGQQFVENSQRKDFQRPNMEPEFQPPLVNANNKITTLPGLVVYGRQIPSRFIPSESQLRGEVPLDQFPSTQFAEQQLEGNSELTQSQPLPEATNEEPALQTQVSPEMQLVSANSEEETTGMPDPVSYNSESPNTFTQPDSKLETNAPFNQLLSKEVQIETTTVPSRDNQFNQLPALGDVNQEIPTMSEPQQTVVNDQMAQQSTPAQKYEDLGMQAELQPVPQYNGEMPNSFVQPDSQFGGSPLTNQFPGNLPPEQSLIGDSEMNQGQTASPDPYAVSQSQTIAQPESLPSQEFGNDRANGSPAFYKQQYPSSSVIPNAQLIDSTGFPSAFSAEQQPVGNNDMTQPQLTSGSTNDNENTLPQFPANEEPQPQPSPGFTDQYLNNGRNEIPAFGVVNQQIPTGLSYEDSQMQGTVRPDFQFPVENTDERANVSPVPNSEQIASTSIPSASQLQDSQLFSQNQPESQLQNNEFSDQISSTIIPEKQLSENEQISQFTPNPVVTSQDPQLQDSQPQTRLPDFNFNKQQIPGAFVPIESQIISNTPFGQFPQRQQPVGLYETEQSQSIPGSSNDELREQATAAPQPESVAQYPSVQPTGLPDQQTPNEFVQPIQQVQDNSPFSQSPSTLSPEEQPIGNDEIPQFLSSTASTNNDQTPQQQPSENYANDGRAGLLAPGFINQQIPNVFVLRTPTNAGFRGLPAAQQENQSNGAIYPERSSEMEDPTSSALVAQPEAFPPPLEINNEQPSPANIQPPVSQDDFQGSQNPTLADSDQNASFTPQMPFENPSVTSFQNEPQFNNQRDLISSTETSDASVTTLAPGKESFGNPEQTFNTSPSDSNTSVGYEDQSNPVYTNAGNPLFVNPNLPYSYTPSVKPYFRDEQSPMTVSTDLSVSSTDQFPANNPTQSDSVYNQNSSGNLDQSQTESEMSQQTSNVYPPSEPVPSQQVQSEGQFVPLDNPTADLPNTDSSTTSYIPSYAPQSTYGNSQPIPSMPEVGPEAVSPVPNEYDGRPSKLDSYVGDDFSQTSQRKFSPRPILLYGNERPFLANPETTLSPSITTYSEDDSEFQSEQFPPEDSTTPIPPNQNPSDFENPPTELQRPTEMQSSDNTISATPEPTVNSQFEEQATPDPLPNENQNPPQQDVNQYSGYPNQLYMGPLNPNTFRTPNVQFPPQPLNPSYESQNLQQPFYSNPIPSQAPNSEEQVVSAFPQNENQSSFTPDEVSEPQWKAPGNPQPTENDDQTEEVTDTAFPQQPPTVYPVFNQAGSAQPVIPFQPPATSEQLSSFGATEFPSEQQENPLNKFNKRIDSTEYETTVISTEQPEYSNSFSTVKPLSEQQMTPDSNNWDSSADSVVTAQPISAPTVSGSDSTVSYSPVQPRPELESQSLISTAGNDQPFPGTFQPSYVPESQTETTLPYSNGPSVGFTPSFSDSERTPLSSPSPFNVVQTSTESEDTSAFYTPASVTSENPSYIRDPSNFVNTVPPTFQSEPERVDDSLSPQPISGFNQFPPADSLIPQAPTYDGNYKPAEGMDQTSTTFDNTTPLPSNPEAFGGTAYPATTFQPQSQTPFSDEMNTNGDYPLPDTQTPQSFGESPNANFNAPTTAVTSDDIYTSDSVSRNPGQDMGLQTDYGTTPPNQPFSTLPVETPNRLGQYEPQPIQETPEFRDNVSPQIQSTTMNYDEETNTYQSSPAPQPQMTLNNVDQLSDDNIASISPGKQENASPTFEPTPVFNSQRDSEFPDTQFQPVTQSQVTQDVISNNQPPSTVFEPSTMTETVNSDISFSNQPDIGTNEGVPRQIEPEISPNPAETFNQAVEPTPTDYAGNSGKTDYPGDFAPSSSPYEKPFQTEVSATQYDRTEETSHFPLNYQPQFLNTQTQSADPPMYNGNTPTDFSEAPETQLTNTDNINNSDELGPVPGSTALPPQDSSTITTESSSYSDSALYNVRRRPNGRLFDMSTLPQSEENYNQQAEYSPAFMPKNTSDKPEQPLGLGDQTTPVDSDPSTQSPEAAVTQYDEATQNNVPAMRQPFDNPTEQPGLYNPQLEVPVQPQTDSPLDFEEGSTRRPVTFTPNSESFANPPPPMQEEPHFNPLFHTLESHLIVPLPEPQQPSTASSSFQEPLYVDPREASPVPNDSLFQQSNQNRFSTSPPNFRRPDFDQNFVTSQPQPNAGDVMNTPQSDSQALVSDLTTPSNKPGSS